MLLVEKSFSGRKTTLEPEKVLLPWIRGDCSVLTPIISPMFFAAPTYRSSNLGHQDCAWFASWHNFIGVTTLKEIKCYFGLQNYLALSQCFHKLVRYTSTVRVTVPLGETLLDRRATTPMNDSSTWQQSVRGLSTNSACRERHSRK